MRDIKICSYVSGDHFEFWSGAVNTVETLRDAGLFDQAWDLVCEMLECGNDDITETSINDMFWFESDYIAECLGYDDFEDLEYKNSDDEEEDNEDEE